MKGNYAMNSLNIAENLINLRRKRGVTQDELAAFLNITKASVSKWETKQSYPDILLLPQIAAYFDVSIDDLLGYQPQLSPDQIKKCYLDLAEGFAKLPFDEVMAKSKCIVKEYYSCFELLMHIANLWINHYMLADDQEKQLAILNETTDLCNHILDGCSDVSICSNVIQIKAIVNLVNGNAKEVIEELEPLLESNQFRVQSDPLLLQAYIMTGDLQKANLYSQISIYTSLLSLVSGSISMMNFNINDQKLCEETILRLKKVIEAYDLENLHPNTALQFHYLSAVFYCTSSQIDKALVELKTFVLGSINYIENGLALKGDNYFDRIEEWFDKLPLKAEAPRNEKVVFESLLPAIENHVFSVLYETKEYIDLKNVLENKRKEVN